MKDINNALSIKVERLTKDELVMKGVFSWPVWDKGISRFDWSYDDKEECYFLSGSVTVTTDSGDTSFGAGDFVTFPKGLRCVWKVVAPVRKHYRFG